MGAAGGAAFCFRGFEVPPGLKPWSFAHEFLITATKEVGWAEREVRHLLPGFRDSSD